MQIIKAAIPGEGDLDEQTGSVESEIMLFRALLQLNAQDRMGFLLVCVYGSETINNNRTICTNNTAL
jgi:hypothetical protein